MRLALLASTFVAGTLIASAASADRPWRVQSELKNPDTFRTDPLRARGELADENGWVARREPLVRTPRTTVVMPSKAQPSTLPPAAAVAERTLRTRAELADENGTVTRTATPRATTPAGKTTAAAPRAGARCPAEICSVVRRMRTTAGDGGDEGYVVTATDVATGKAPPPAAATRPGAERAATTAKASAPPDQARRETPAERNARIRDAVRTHPVLARILKLLKRGNCGKVGEVCETEADSNY